MKLRLKTRVVNGINVIDCDGRIVIGEEIEALRETGHKLIVENPHIVLNLKNVINIDSSGLGMLVGLYTTAKNAHGEIKLAELYATLRQVDADYEVSGQFSRSSTKKRMRSIRLRWQRRMLVRVGTWDNPYDNSSLPTGALFRKTEFSTATPAYRKNSEIGYINGRRDKPPPDL